MRAIKAYRGRQGLDSRRHRTGRPSLKHRSERLREDVPRPAPDKGETSRASGHLDHWAGFEAASKNADMALSTSSPAAAGSGNAEALATAFADAVRLRRPPSEVPGKGQSRSLLDLFTASRSDGPSILLVARKERIASG